MSHSNLPVQDPDLGHSIADPGVEEHIDRYSDVNKGAGNRAYGAILLMLAAVPVLCVLFVVIYFAVPKDMVIDFGLLHANASTVGLGLTAGIALSLIGVAVIQWARVLMGDEEMVELRHSAASTREDREAVSREFAAGVEQSGIKRRRLLLGALGGAVGFTAVPGLILFADMGPHPTDEVRKDTIEKTIWAPDVVLVNDENWVPLRPEDLEIGQLVNAQPANLLDLEGAEQIREKAKAAIIVVRMDPASITIPDSRKDWQVSGILAYSKICTHVGCPISLWERQTHHLLCPCHQSTFDLGNSGVVVFGPAARSLPQLPIRVNDEGYLVARSDFTVPVGPSYFERDSRHDFKDGDQ